MKTLKIYLFLSLFFSLSLQAQENVGIGTTTPQAKLHIAGDLQVEDLAGQGERTVIATPEGKLKAVTNTEPNPSNTDTLNAQFIELTDGAGNTRFIFNAHTGQFQMMDNDTVWYEIEVNSPPTLTQLLLKEVRVASSKQEDIDVAVARGIAEIESFKFLSNSDEALDLLQNGTVTAIDTESSPANNSPTNLFLEKTFLITTPEGDKAVLQLKGNFITTTSINIIGKKPSESRTVEETEEDEVLQITEDTNINSSTTTVRDEEGEVISQFTEGINEDQQPFSTLTDFLNSTTNTLFSNENTISNTETGSSVSTQIDENGTPKIQLTDGGSTITTIDAEKIEQTDSETGETKSTLVDEVLQRAKDFIESSQAQENQRGTIDQTTADITTAQQNNQTQGEQIDQNTQNIANKQDQNNTQNEQIDQNTADIAGKKDQNDTQDEEIQDLKDCITDLQEDAEPEGEITSDEFTATEGSNTSNLKPTELTIESDDGTKADISPSGIVLTAPNGAQLFLDCFALSKFKPGKSLPFVGVDFNINQEKLDVFADLDVFGNITELGKKVTKIDHPNDPTQQYLQHSTVNTNELLHLYSGNSTTNAEGKATVQLPSYIQDLNTDFRYQLTVIGDTFAQAIIAQKVTNNQFVIQTNEPNVKVSWQVTGLRNDTYAQENPLEVEVSD